MAGQVGQTHCHGSAFRMCFSNCSVLNRGNDVMSGHTV